MFLVKSSVSKQQAKDLGIELIESNSIDVFVYCKSGRVIDINTSKCKYSTFIFSIDSATIKGEDIDIDDIDRDKFNDVILGVIAKESGLFWHKIKDYSFRRRGNNDYIVAYNN